MVSSVSTATLAQDPVATIEETALVSVPSSQVAVTETSPMSSHTTESPPVQTHGVSLPNNGDFTISVTVTSVYPSTTVVSLSPLALLPGPPPDSTVTEISATTIAEPTTETIRSTAARVAPSELPASSTESSDLTSTESASRSPSPTTAEVTDIVTTSVITGVSQVTETISVLQIDSGYSVSSVLDTITITSTATPSSTPTQPTETVTVTSLPSPTPTQRTETATIISIPSSTNTLENTFTIMGIPPPIIIDGMPATLTPSIPTTTLDPACPTHDCAIPPLFKIGGYALVPLLLLLSLAGFMIAVLLFYIWHLRKGRRINRGLTAIDVPMEDFRPRRRRRPASEPVPEKDPQPKRAPPRYDEVWDDVEVY